MNVFQELHAMKGLKKVLTLLSQPLFLKKAGTVDVKDYCLISLVNGVYRSLSKVLGNILSMVMEKIRLKPKKGVYQR